MAKTPRVRIDWMPGPAALEALEKARQLRPGMRQQDLIDYLVLHGLWVLRWAPPPLLGRDRDRWVLPGSSTSEHESKPRADPGSALRDT